MSEVDVILDCIVFDLQPSGGISRFWVNLISSLAALAAGPRLHILINAKPSSKSALKVVDLARSNSRLALYPYTTRSVERIRSPRIPGHLLERGIFHSSYYRTVARMPNVSTIHDFTNEDLVGGWRALAQSWQKTRGVAKSSRIVCVSESTRRDFQRHFAGYASTAIRVIHHGVEDIFLPLIQADEHNPPYVLFVGRRDDYKNFWCVAEAVSRLKSFQLRIVGPPLTAEEHARLENLCHGLYALSPHADDGELVELYQNAFALVYPSRYEGFGLPVLEAMASGCPVIAVSASSIPEIAGNAAILLQVATADSIVQALEQLKDHASRRDMILRGFERCRRFTWAQAANQYAAVYAALATGG